MQVSELRLRNFRCNPPAILNKGLAFNCLDERENMLFDVCNGDADGLCSVVQWRLHAPGHVELITGLKRDIALLSRVTAQAGDEVLVCDISMRRNLQDLLRLLDAGAHVCYFDHHAVDAVPRHPLLDAHIDMAANVCSSLLVDQYLRGQFRVWAVVGAFGDNLTATADLLASKTGINATDRQRLRTLGESINYNAYGDSMQDVCIPPDELFDILLRFPDPLELLDRTDIGQQMDAMRRLDMQRALAVAPYCEDDRCAVFVLPDLAWSRRVTGSWMNQLAATSPGRAHAVLRVSACGDYVVSVRAPVDAPRGASQLCRAFGGDGRAGAAGIDRLPANGLMPFLAAFTKSPWYVATGTSPATPGA